MLSRSRAPMLSAIADDSEVLLTGATGLIGGAVLGDLLRTTRARVTLLVRAGSPGHARARIDQTVESWLGVEGRRATAHRVCAISADLEHETLGLDHSTRERLVARVTHVIHAAASVRFDNPLAVARAINVGGLRQVLALAEEAHARGRLRRLTFVSTAFVSGRVARPFAEHELDLCQGFRNTYEQSKFEAERLAREFATRVPITIVRPSVVIGHSTTGYTTAFNVLYVPVRLLLRAPGYVTLPLRSLTPLDSVPVDWVAAVIREAVFNGRDGQTYTAASGRAHLTMDDVAALVAEVFAIPRARLLPADSSDDVVGYALEAWSTRLSARSRGALAVFAPYLLHGARFDTRWCDQLMSDAAAHAPNPRAVLRQSLEYARDTGFGRLLDRRPEDASGRRLPALPRRAVA